MSIFPLLGRAVPATLTLLCAGVLVVCPARPASAHHLDAIVVTQVAADELAVTVRVDVTYNGAAGGGIFSWTTGDGGDAALPDGTTSVGAYLGDASGTGTYGGSRPVAVVDTATFDWIRTQPSPGVARTVLRFRYARGGAYTMTWTDCCDQRAGSLPLAVRDPAGATPYFPTGVVEISGESAATAHVVFEGFVPDLALWQCTISPWTGGATSVTCTPPPTPGTYNVCGVVAVEVESGETAYADGSSRCESGLAARGVAGPWAPATPDVQAPRSAFPWTCAASVRQPTVATAWLVRCAVGP